MIDNGISAVGDSIIVHTVLRYWKSSLDRVDTYYSMTLDQLSTANTILVAITTLYHVTPDGTAMEPAVP